MSKQKQKLGRWGEDLAAEHLIAKGYEVLARNVRGEFGELDLIARQGEEIVFVEVKTRSSTQFGYPEEAITPAKQQHILDAAQAFLQAHPEYEGDWRVDVIAVRRVRGKTPEILHFENALS